MSLSRRILVPLLLIVFGTLGAGLAQAELGQDGNVRISFSGDFSPHSLPRERPAPIRINVRGAIGTTDGSHPPAVDRIEIELNRYGLLTTRGLPSCKASTLQATSSETALRRCRPALVGKGSFRAAVELSSAPPVLANGALLAFFGKSNGKPALLLHLYVTTPVQTTMVLPLVISHRAKGKFGTVLAGRIPTLAGGLGSVTQIDLSIGRDYTYRGQRLSFVSASCPAPAGFTGAPFSLARGSFFFADGKQIEATLARDCRVR